MKKVNNRLETNIRFDVSEEPKIETKIDEYTSIQTDIKSKKSTTTGNIKIQTEINKANNKSNNNFTQNIESGAKGKKNPKKSSKTIATSVKGIKVLSNTANKTVKTGKTLNTAVESGGAYKTFQNSANKWLSKPVKKVVNKTTKPIQKKIASTATNVLTSTMKVLMKLLINVVKMILSMLPQIAPVIIILIAMASFLSFFGMNMSESTKTNYESYMLSIQNEYDNITVPFFQQGNVVEGTIDGKGLINWRAPLSIIQMLNAELTYDDPEQELLNKFRSADLYEKITDETYTVDVPTDNNSESNSQTATKKVVYNSNLDDYINWCNNNFNVINTYKQEKGLPYDLSQTEFTDSEIEEIKMLYSSTVFFDLFSDKFKETYAYENVKIDDEKIQAIYDEFLKNVGKPYKMDHSNLTYDICMGYYDCSSLVLHIFGHTGITKLPNVSAVGLYETYCNPITVNARKAGDLIFLKDTYDTGNPGGISHVGIYMGELTINGKTTEWIIDTGGNPQGVKITEYNNGWWTGSHFYGFGRLK